MIRITISAAAWPDAFDRLRCIPFARVTVLPAPRGARNVTVDLGVW